MRRLLERIKALVLVENYAVYDVYSTHVVYLGVLASFRVRVRELWSAVK